MGDTDGSELRKGGGAEVSQSLYRARCTQHTVHSWRRSLGTCAGLRPQPATIQLQTILSPCASPRPSSSRSPFYSTCGTVLTRHSETQGTEMTVTRKLYSHKSLDPGARVPGRAAWGSPGKNQGAEESVSESRLWFPGKEQGKLGMQMSS